MAHFQIFFLVFLAPHNRRQFVLRGIRVSSIFGEDKRSVQVLAGPLVHLCPESRLCVTHLVPAHKIPAIVTVHTDHICQMIAFAGIRQGIHDQRKCSGALLHIQLMSPRKHFLKIWYCGLICGLRLV